MALYHVYSIQCTLLCQVRRLASEAGAQARTLATQLAELLTEGAITQETLLDSVPRLLAVVRESNVVLR